MITTKFYERRNGSQSINFDERRVAPRRNGQKQPATREQRRLASQIRRYEREAFKIPVRLKIENEEFSGYTHDINPDGILVFTGTALRFGMPMSLRFSFGKDVCSLNISGQVVFSRLVEKNGAVSNAIGIKFSGIREFEKQILASAVQELKQNTEAHDKSLLNILVSPDTLAQESANFSNQIPKTSTSAEKGSPILPIQSPAFERRSSPRMTLNYPVRLFPDDIKGGILNLSETGLGLTSEKPIHSKEVSLSVDFPSQQTIEISAEILKDRGNSEGQYYFGGRFSALDKAKINKIRDLIFNDFAKKASSVVKNNDDLKIKIEDFFNKDVKQYHEDLSKLVIESHDPGAKAEAIERKVTMLTDELLLKGDALSKTISNDMYMKKVKQVFRELSGCWVYKSPIMKMGYEKPRGYPGDYRLFEIIYDDKPLSEGGIGIHFDKYFLNNTYTKAVRSRKDKMKGILKGFIEGRSPSCVKLLNVACGGSKEIRELFSEPFIYGKEIVFTGLDNDEGGLDLSRALLNYLPPNVKTRFFKENVLNIFRDENYYGILGKQDIIYILGLTEYLPDRIFKKLIYFLFQLLNDNGKLVITYKDKNIPVPGIPPDWLCDWAFIKRSEDDLINAAKILGEDKYSLKIEREGTGCIMFLMLTKI